MTRAAYEVEIEERIAAEPWLLYRAAVADYGLPRAAFRALRQPSMGRAGRADLLIIHPFGLSIVECKRDRVDDRTVGQAVRYLGSMLTAIRETSFPEPPVIKKPLFLEAVCVAPSRNDACLWASEYYAEAYLIEAPMRFLDWNNGRPTSVQAPVFKLGRQQAEVLDWIRAEAPVCWAMRPASTSPVGDL